MNQDNPTIQNPLLRQALAALEEHVPKGKETIYAKIVLQGQKVMYDDRTHYLMLEQMHQDIPPERVAGEGAAKLLGILFEQSKSTMPMDVAIVAMLSLMIEYIDFMEDAGRCVVNEQLLAGATQAFLVNLTQMMGLTPDKLAQMGEAGAKAKAQMGQQPAQPQPAPAPGIVGQAMAPQQPMMGG